MMRVNDPARSTTVAATRSSPWRRLAIGAGVVAAGAHLVFAAGFRDLDPLFVAVSFAVALGVTRVRRGTLGFVLLTLAFANVAFWTVTATARNLVDDAGFVAAGLPATMAVLAGVGLIACVALLARRDDPSAGTAGARLTVAGGCAVLLALLVGAALGSGTTTIPEDAEVVIADRTAFVPEELVAAAGEVTVAFDNRDYFWHTFTVPELGVDLRVPVGATGLVTFDAEPGRYDFVCAIPGHEHAGMTGVLIVEGHR
jgi:plastocyanin